jgi:hypothetical protein
MKLEPQLRFALAKRDERQQPEVYQNEKGIVTQQKITMNAE